jgi:uncharacterized membrane protein YagU involved in acid resistance
MTTDTPTSTPSASQDGSSPPTPGLSTGRWLLSALLGSAVAWGLLNFPPIAFQLPVELHDVNNMSPPDLQRQLAEKVTELYWKNSVSMFTFAGLGLGLVTMLVATWPVPSEQRKTVAVAAVLGIVGGLLAALIGMGLRHQFGPDGAFSKYGEGDSILIGDMLVYLSLSVMLVVSVATGVCLQGGEGSSQRGGAVVLAGILAGGALPLTTVFFPNLKTNIFPPNDPILTAIWFLLIGLAVGFLPGLMGAKPAKKGNSPPAAEDA